MPRRRISRHAAPAPALPAADPQTEPRDQAWYPPDQDHEPVPAEEYERLSLHEFDEPEPEPSGEPVVLSQALTVALGAAVSLGWVKLDDTAVNLVATAVASVIIAAATVVTRSRVWTRAAVRRELARRTRR